MKKATSNLKKKG